MTERLFSPLARAARWIAKAAPTEPPAIEDAPRRVRAVDPIAPAPSRSGWWHGSKYPGGMTGVNLLTVDYWTLRARSAEFFRTNIYARGFIRRLVENEINTGLHLEARPEAQLLGYEPDGLAGWSETVENRFRLWADNPLLCDFQGRETFGELQAAIRRESLIDGDILVTAPQDPVTRLPRVRLYSGAVVQTPLEAPRRGNKILHGVELDAQGRHVAYWIRQDDLTSKRLPAWGPRSGRRIAWLVYGADKRHEDVRGEPLLSLMMQSVREIDRYRDAVQRKATINAIIAMAIEREQGTFGGGASFANAAISRGTDTAMDATGTSRSFPYAEFAPGVLVDHLEPGEKLKGFSAQGTDEKFGDFQDAIVAVLAWANGIPPEILTLSFNSNYSASQAAINEFKLHLNVVRTQCGSQMCRPYYLEWLLSECLSRKLENAAAILASWRDPSQYDVFGAWTSNDWSGHIKPAVDFSKLVRGYKEAIDEGLITRDRAARELTGTKYSKNIEQLARENEQKAKADAALGQSTGGSEDSSESGVEDQSIDREEDDDESPAGLRRAV